MFGKIKKTIEVPRPFHLAEISFQKAMKKSPIICRFCSTFFAPHEQKDIKVSRWSMLSSSTSIGQQNGCHCKDTSVSLGHRDGGASGLCSRDTGMASPSIEGYAHPRLILQLYYYEKESYGKDFLYDLKAPSMPKECESHKGWIDTLTGIVLLSVFIKIVSCQFQMPYPSSTKPTQPTTMKNVYQAAPLHYVNIGRKLDGDYKFGYDTGKGPSGQSFREEIRLADGTISGSYGVIDELGHKRVVHFSAGKPGFLSQEEPAKETLSTTTAPSALKPYLNTITRHFTSPLASFNLANYLHLKRTTPALKQSTPTQQNIVIAPRQSTEQNMVTFRQSNPAQQNMITSRQANPIQQNMITSRQANPIQQNMITSRQSNPSQQNMITSRQSNPAQQNMIASRQSTPTQQNVIAPPRQSSSQQNMITVDRHSNSGQKQNVVASSRQSISTQQNAMAPTRQLTTTNQNMIAAAHQKMFSAPHLYTYGVSSEQQKTLTPFMESFRTGNLQRQTEVDAPSKAQNLQMKDAAYLASTYDPKLEDEYYDNAPPFIDIERLSYNIGTDKNASLKI
ncbi:hypothetical protein HNY73_020678 [Argiope bruennichi]|uniref:Uncharacterized protein n=1 Tax=Argiope bruennichi TaxID=94029 RepID=A0A8T0EBF9_ARGBR|nr:hypothetical protein HNY73_020678 [Argiope bruennichi]